jgi:4-hydroxy-tetrahydrodipicolinate synthase
MMNASVEHLSPGVWGILATPFRGPNFEVDTASLRTLVEHYRRVGAQGVVALGVLGEAARLDSRERELVMRIVVEAAGPLPVVAGMSATATAPAIEEARRAADAGVGTVMVLVSTGDPLKLARHLDQIAAASGCDIVLQDHPATTGIVVAPAILAEVVQKTQVIMAIKAEAPPTAPTIAALVATIDVPVFGGLGGVGLLDELLAGSAGAMTGFAFPEALVATVAAWQQNGYAAAREAFIPWMPLVLFEAQEKISLALRKEILRRRGLITESAVRPPGVAMPESLVPALEAHLSAMDSVETTALTIGMDPSRHGQSFSTV